jgi:YidC/Oxa1 family membrane protein insertase
MTKNMPADAMSGQYAQQQKLLLYILPVVFAVGGVAFPLGVLFYWTTSNLWTMGQQLFVIRNNPVPGTPAHKAKLERDALHGKGPAAETPTTGVIEAPRPVQRQQPRNQPRSQRKKSGPPQAPKKKTDITKKLDEDTEGTA